MPWQQPLGHEFAVHVATTVHWPELQVPVVQFPHAAPPSPQALLF